jgi:hypothetical protein
MMKKALVVTSFLVTILLVASAGCEPAPLDSRAGNPGEGQNAEHSASGTSVAAKNTSMTPDAQGSDTPSEIGRLYPLAGSQACPRPHVGADLLLTDAMRKDGSFDPSTVTLTLDGTDVTQTATIRESQTNPSSRATILHLPTTDLALGDHSAAITFASATGPITHEWSFTVADISCPE